MEKFTEVYRLGGITFVSEIALPELIPIQRDDTTAHPVQIRLGTVARHLPGAVEIDPGCFATRTQYLLSIEGVARYLLRDGREIVVQPEPLAVALDVRGYLLGSVFVVLCQQRGLLPLHASVVAGAAGAAAFIAHSGQGKSTLAADLGRRGLRVLADDVCLVDTAQTPALVTATAPWMKLWQASLDHLGKPAEGLERVFSDEDKYRLPLVANAKPEAIRQLFFLESRNDVSVTTIGAISRLEALNLLMHFAHHAFVLEATGQREETFVQCSRVLSQATAWRLIRPWGLEHLSATVDAVQPFLLEEPGRAAD